MNVRQQPRPTPATTTPPTPTPSTQATASNNTDKKFSSTSPKPQPPARKSSTTHRQGQTEQHCKASVDRSNGAKSSGKIRQILLAEVKETTTTTPMMGFIGWTRRMWPHPGAADQISQGAPACTVGHFTRYDSEQRKLRRCTCHSRMI